ncbi:MAG: UDP-glucose/GDP-mannose dehydrogenase family protein [Proteobacteria bacterium]|nr:MAG: UDP-glucose/GDP-mannose dehydrogenase family protein [Pseudomonadota bacterium]QKK11423.1 MAG: UDP-glucose/GDP-mannose dehydrogenase family protein [Pseudomonadota bacterium]
MKVTVYGCGYVGLVTGACLAHVGNHVLCVDVIPERVEGLRNGVVPIHEPGLDNIVRDSIAAGRLTFTTDPAAAAAHSTLQFIAVGTPPDEDGSADLQYVLAVAAGVARHMDGHRVLVNKSTVPVGTADRVRETVARVLGERNAEFAFDVVSNPEFLKEGAAIDDFMKPDRIVVGTESAESKKLMQELYAPFNRNHDRLLVMDVRSAELTKYAANAMLATKISFMNELANIAEHVGADVEQVRIGIGSDPRIGYHFIYPGCGYGGSCFPKDVKALIRTAAQIGYAPELLEAVDDVNDRQKQVLFSKITREFGENLTGRTFALWGLAFKPNTDDMREASSRDLMEALWRAGARVQAHDPVAMKEVERIYGQRDDLVLCKTPEDALRGADALVIATEWLAFRSPDFDFIREQLKTPTIFDGRNLYDPKRLAERGFRYYAIGRGLSLRS